MKGGLSNPMQPLSAALLRTLSTAAAAQLAWYIAPTTGNDANDGATSGTPIKTFAEFHKRIGANLVPGVTVTLLEDCAENFVFDATSGAFDEFAFILKGTQTQVDTGTISATQAYSTSAGGVGADGTITDSSKADAYWSTHTKQLIVLTSGAHSGAFAWVTKNLGTKKCRHTPFYDPATFGLCDPAVADTYALFTLTAISGAPKFRSAVVLEDLWFDTNTFPSFDTGSRVTTMRCRFSNGVFVGSMSRATGCLFDTYDWTLFDTSAHTSFNACGFVGAGLTVYPPAFASIDLMCIVDTKANPVAPYLGGTLFVNAPLGFFDTPAGSGLILAYAGPGLVHLAAKIFGTGNAAQTALLYVGGGTRVVAQAAANLPNNLAGPVAFALIGGTTKTLANLQSAGYQNPNNGSAVFVGDLT